ncbi:MAG: NADH-quinone oxidoreductase subunit M [Bdellovibrionota bacterium]
MLKVLLWPLIVAFVLSLFPKSKKSWAQWTNLLLHLPWILFLLALVKVTPLQGAPFGLFESYATLPVFKSLIALGADTLNVSLVALTLFLSFSLSLYFIGHEKISVSFLVFFHLLNFGTVGSLLAADAFLFYVFWEFMLIPLFFLIGIWGSENRVYAALKFFAMTLAGSLALLAAIFFISSMPEVASLEWTQIRAQSGLISQHPWIIWAFLVAFLVKVPVWPLHTWLPDAHTEAPTAISVMLAGVLLKLGVYGMLRWCLQLFPEMYWSTSDILFVAGLVGIILGSYGALRQTDIKRMIAYSSVAHLGFIVIGITSTSAAAQSGAFFQNFAHGLSTGLLFLCFGMIYDRTHSRKLADYGGLATSNRFLAFTFVFAAMASVGLPGLPGFIGEFLILSGTFYQRGLWVLIPLMGVLLGALYTLPLVKGLVFGKVSPLVESHPLKLKWNEVLALLPYLVGLVVLGLLPQILLNWTQGSIPVR